jgi:hypothetical protein
MSQFKKAVAAAMDEYMAQHQLSIEQQLTRVLNNALASREPDPLRAMGNELLALSANSHGEPPKAGEDASRLAERIFDFVDKKGTGNVSRAEWRSAFSALSTNDAEALATASSGTSDWSVAGWLQAVELEEFTASALKPLLGDDPLAFLRNGLTLDSLRARLRDAGLEGLAAPVWAEVGKLRKERTATSSEMQAKFQQEGAGMLSYGGLSTFYSGLEGMIGSPHPDVRLAMKLDHTKHDDSHADFTTHNYEVTSTSAIEYRFVAQPDNPPAEGWPVEEKLRRALSAAAADDASLSELRASGARERIPEPLEKMQAAADECNRRLAKMDEPDHLLDEALGARLYTGPLLCATMN